MKRDGLYLVLRFWITVGLISRRKSLIVRAHCRIQDDTDRQDKRNKRQEIRNREERGERREERRDNAQYSEGPSWIGRYLKYEHQVGVGWSSMQSWLAMINDQNALFWVLKSWLELLTAVSQLPLANPKSSWPGWLGTALIWHDSGGSWLSSHAMGH